MKDFALALLAGMASGVYSTIYIAGGVVNFWEKVRTKRRKKAASASTPPGSLPAKA
jgi:preprotein translocase subunit SecF